MRPTVGPAPAFAKGGFTTGEDRTSPLVSRELAEWRTGLAEWRIDGEAHQVDAAGRKQQGGTTMAGKRLQWHPTPEEVAAIVVELRPMIAAMARRQSTELARLAH
jgi:hypothetical protein